MNCEVEKYLDISNSVRYHIIIMNWTPKAIKALRDQYQISQPKLGSLLGVSGNYIYLLEKGVKRPSKTLELLLNCVEKELRKKKRKGV